MNRVIRCLFLIAGLLFAATSHADLFRVGPVDPSNGYPEWYQDSNGLVLDLCIPQGANQLDPCLATPLPGDPDPDFPFVFDLDPAPPNTMNWPDELFWYGAEAIMDIGGGESALLVEAIEAAFVGGPALAGDQIAFARIRIRFVVPVDGNYTVTFPYGEVPFPNQSAGDRLFYTNDVGIGSPGDFTGALTGDIDFFLRAVNADGTLKPLFPITTPDPVTGINVTANFLSNPIDTTLVTGSATNTNYFEVCVDNGVGLPPEWLLVAGKGWCVSTDQFALIGKVHEGAIASPLNIARATYATHVDAGGALMPMAHIDVYATAEPAPFEANPDLTIGIVDAPSVRMNGPNDLGGLFYGEAIVDRVNRPASITVINSADQPPSSVTASLTDAITIFDASYDATSGDLSIVAKSSDEADPPELTATVAGVTCLGGVNDKSCLVLDASGSLIVNITDRVDPDGGVGGRVPPRTVTVSSTHAGSATALVRMPTHGTAFATGAPLAVDDFVWTTENPTGGIVTSLLIKPLDNDGTEASSISLTLEPGSGPSHGNVVPNGDGTLTYTPATDYFGTEARGTADSFQYTVKSQIGNLSSNIATVTIDVRQINTAPVAVADNFSVVATDLFPTVDVTANDTDVDGIAPAPGGLDPLSASPFNVIGGSVEVNPVDGKIVFTKDLNNCSSGCSFEYTVRDIGTATSLPLSSNPVSVTITNVANNIPPTAVDDTGSTPPNLTTSINVLVNDIPGTGTILTDSVNIDPLSITGGTVVSVVGGVVTYTAPSTAGTYSFTYTISDSLGEVSAPATITVTVAAVGETLTVDRAQCKASKSEWRIDGTSNPNSSIAVYGSDIPTAGVAGSVPLLTVQADELGAWRVSKRNFNGDCTAFVSVQSESGNRLENQQVLQN